MKMNCEINLKNEEYKRIKALAEKEGIPFDKVVTDIIKEGFDFYMFIKEDFDFSFLDDIGKFWINDHK